MNPTIQLHPERSELQAYLDDTLVSARSETIASHLDHCGTCQQKMDLLSNAFSGTLVDTLRKLNHRHDVRVEEDHQAGDTFQEEIVCRNGKRYLLMGEVARGGMGIVFQGYDPEMHREIAIKIMNPTLDIDADDLLRFQREARLAAQLQHPGIVPIHELGHLKDGRLYIAMKLVAGTTLRQLIDRGHSTPKQKSHLLEVFHQICQTMAYTHSREIIHRDLKPDNVMVGPFGEVQVMDWGIAKSLGDSGMEVEEGDYQSATAACPPLKDTIAMQPRVEPLRFSPPAIGATKAGTVFGTPAYMSPEQAHGKPTDKRSDVFALGAILTEIMTGHAPYCDGKTPPEVDQAATSNLDSTFRRLDQCGHDIALIHLAKDCLSPNSIQRPADAGVVHNRLSTFFCQRDEKLRESELSTARAEARFTEEQKRRKQVSILFGTIAAVLLFTMAAGLLYLNERNNRQLETTQRQSEREHKIRSALRSVQHLSAPTSASKLGDSNTCLRQALEQINRVEGLTESSIDGKLYSEFLAEKERIECTLAEAEKRLAVHQKDDAMSSAIHSAIRRSLYPSETLKYFRDPAVTTDIANAFQTYGIVVGADLNQAAALIRQSNINLELVSGLRLWRTQAVNQKPASRDPKLIDWIGDLTLLVDTDPFRSHIRAIEKKGEADLAKKAMVDPRAIDSIQTAHVMLDCLRSLDCLEEQQAFLVRAQRKFPDDFEINWRLAGTYRKQPGKDLRAALQYYQICLALQPDNPGVLIDLGWVLFRLEEYELAISYSEIMLRVAPEFPEAHVTIAICLSKLNRSEEAIESCYDAIEMRPNFPAAQYNRSIIAGILNRSDEALEAINLAIDGQPSTKHYIHRARIYQRNKQFDEAIQSLAPALQRYPNNKMILLWLGDMYAQSHRLDTALVYYRTADDAHPHDSHIMRRIADALIDLGRADEAELVSRGVVKTGWPGWKINCSLIEAIGEQGRIEEARALYQKMKSEYPTASFPNRTETYYQNHLVPSN